MPPLFLATEQTIALFSTFRKETKVKKLGSPYLIMLL